MELTVDLGARVSLGGKSHSPAPPESSAWDVSSLGPPQIKANAWQSSLSTGSAESASSSQGSTSLTQTSQANRVKCNIQDSTGREHAASHPDIDRQSHSGSAKISEQVAMTSKAGHAHQNDIRSKRDVSAGRPPRCIMPACLNLLEADLILNCQALGKLLRIHDLLQQF